jgi:hypothetical protein
LLPAESAAKTFILVHYARLVASGVFGAIGEMLYDAWGENDRQ